MIGWEKNYPNGISAWTQDCIENNICICVVNKRLCWCSNSA